MIRFFFFPFFLLACVKTAQQSSLVSAVNMTSTIPHTVPQNLIGQIRVTTSTIIEEDQSPERPSISASEILDIVRRNYFVTKKRLIHTLLMTVMTFPQVRPGSPLYYLRKNIGHVRNLKDVRQEIPAFHDHTLAHDLRQDALIMPHPTLARRCFIVPFHPRATRPRAIQAAAPTAEQSTVPLPRMDQPHDRNQYILLTPVFPLDNSADMARDLQALLKHNDIRGEYPPVDPKDRVELALIRKERYPVPTFTMANVPWGKLVPRTAVECLGQLEGDWEVTSRVERRGNGIYSLWVSDGKRRKAWVRVDKHGQGPGVAYQLTWAFKKARAFFGSPDSSLTDAPLPYY